MPTTDPFNISPDEFDRKLAEIAGLFTGEGADKQSQTLFNLLRLKTDEPIDPDHLKEPSPNVIMPSVVTNQPEHQQPDHEPFRWTKRKVAAVIGGALMGLALTVFYYNGDDPPTESERRNPSVEQTTEPNTPPPIQPYGS